MRPVLYQELPCRSDPISAASAGGRTYNTQRRVHTGAQQRLLYQPNLKAPPGLLVGGDGWIGWLAVAASLAAFQSGRFQKGA